MTINSKITTSCDVLSVHYKWLPYSVPCACAAFNALIKTKAARPAPAGGLFFAGGRELPNLKLHVCIMSQVVAAAAACAAPLFILF